MAAFAVLGLYRRAQASLTPVAAAVDRYAGYDVSFQFARQILAQPVGDSSVYSLMAANTKLMTDADMAAVVAYVSSMK